MANRFTIAVMYRVLYTERRPGLEGDWDGPEWRGAEALKLVHFRAGADSCSDHRPRTYAKLLYTDEGICGIFRVEDRYVRSKRTIYMEAVYKDSCVEFFVQPEVDSGYFNFEFNCGGTLLCSYITDPERTADGFKKFIPLPKEDGNQVAVYHSLPEIVDPELTEPVIWTLEFFIPFALLEKYAGSLGDPSGKVWRANFYKCGDETSHPHWASWQPLHSLNFHLPECFGQIRFVRIVRSAAVGCPDKD